jgi:predicted MFS family arabinose efflux permease
MVATYGWRNTLFVLAAPSLIVGFMVIWYLDQDGRSIPLSMNEKTFSLKSDLVTLLKTKSVIPIIVIQTLLSGGADLGIVTTYTPLFLADALKLDAYGYIYGSMYTIGLAGGVVGPILLGRYSDKRGSLKTAAFSTLFASILVYLLSFHVTINMFLPIHLFLLGLTTFALPTLLQSQLISITRSNNRDLIIGLFFTVVYAFSSLWSVVIGYIIDMYHSFTPAFLLMGTLGLIAFTLLIRQSRKSDTDLYTPN